MTKRISSEGWRPRRLRRAVLVMGLVLLMHLVAIVGVRRELALASPEPPTQTTLKVALLKAPPPPAAQPPPPAPKPRPPRAVVVPAPAPMAAPTPAPEPVPPPQPEPAPPEPAPPEPSPSTEPQADVKVPSTIATKGRIAYRTTYTRMLGIEAMTYVDWSVDVAAGRYELWLRTVDPVGLLDLRSQGEIRPFGIAPFRYLERIDIANRELSVDFDWLNHIVRFAGRGAGEPTPFDDGTQDPLSLQFHLPLLAQTYPWRFTPGSLIHFQVARRRVESYTFAVDGFEPMLIQGKVIQTLKVIRPKSPDSNRGVEVWMAPDFDWIPARLRFVDTNNEVWDSVLANLPGTEPPRAPIQQEVVKP